MAAQCMGMPKTLFAGLFVLNEVLNLMFRDKIKRHETGRKLLRMIFLKKVIGCKILILLSFLTEVIIDSIDIVTLTFNIFI